MVLPRPAPPSVGRGVGLELAAVHLDVDVMRGPAEQLADGGGAARWEADCGAAERRASDTRSVRWRPLGNRVSLRYP